MKRGLFKQAGELSHCLHSDGASPKPDKRRRATLTH